jgi:hypothetical protein
MCHPKTLKTQPSPVQPFVVTWLTADNAVSAATMTTAATVTTEAL